MTAFRYTAAALATLGAGVVLGLLIVVVRDVAAGRWRL